MGFLRYLGRSVTLLNILLLAAIAAGAVGLMAPVSRLKVKVALPVTKVAPAVEEEKKAEVVQGPSPSDFVVIAEQNLFHPDRKIPIDKKNDLPKPELTLFGTLITDSVRVAYIEDKKSPVTTAGRGKRQTTAKTGDVISGFTITEIDPDKIVLVRGDERMVVPLTDGEKRKSTDQPPGKPQPGQPAGAHQPPVRPTTPPVRGPVPPAVGQQPQPTTPSRPGTGMPTPPARLRGQNLPAPGQQQQ